MTIGSLYNAANVVVGQAALLYAAANTALPVTGTANMADPFDLAVFQTEGAAPYAWNAPGATDQGWKISFGKATQAIPIEEQSTPVATLLTSQTVTIEGSLSEDIATTQALAYNGTSTIVTPSATLAGTTNVALSDDVQEYAVVLLTSMANGMPRWYYIPVCNLLTNVETTFRRSAAKRMYPVSFAAVCKPSQIQVINFTAPKTS